MAVKDNGHFTVETVNGDKIVNSSSILNGSLPSVPKYTIFNISSYSNVIDNTKITADGDKIVVLAVRVQRISAHWIEYVSIA